MNKLIGALALIVAQAVLALGLGLFPSSASGDESNGTVLFIGDSMVEQYNEIPGDLKYAWWSMVADDIRMRPVISAESGAGFLMGGDNCSPLSRRLGERLGAIEVISPDVIVIEAGRNDFRYCAGLEQPALAPRAMTENAIKDFMNDLASALVGQDLSAKDVYVLTPWGTDFPEEAAYIRPMVEKYAESNGFQWVETGILGDKFTLDRTHPNLAGSKELHRRVMDSSDLSTRFGNGATN